MDKIFSDRSSRNFADYFRISSKSAQGRPFLSSESKRIYSYAWTDAIAPFVGNVALGRSLPFIFCVSVRPWPNSGIRTWVPSFWTRRTLGYWVWEPTGTSLKEQGSYNKVQNMGHKGPVLWPR
jgi:hypothetical protein